MPRRVRLCSMRCLGLPIALEMLHLTAARLHVVQYIGLDGTILASAVKRPASEAFPVINPNIRILFAGEKGGRRRRLGCCQTLPNACAQLHAWRVRDREGWLA
jgi:hypothetical protein